MPKKTLAEKCSLPDNFSEHLIIFGFHQSKNIFTNKYSCSVPQHLKDEIAEEKFLSSSYVINRTCYYRCKLYKE